MLQSFPCQMSGNENVVNFVHTKSADFAFVLLITHNTVVLVYHLLAIISSDMQKWILIITLKFNLTISHLFLDLSNIS